MELNWTDADYFIYEKLLAQGWRRSGNLLYCYQCPGCKRCIPIRIRTDRFIPSKSLKRCLKKNQDISVSLHDALYTDERFRLYEKYVTVRHSESSAGETHAENRQAFMDLTEGLQAHLTEYRDQAAILVAEGFVDILPDGISSVYFAFSPEAGWRSLGRFSVHAEIQIARQLQKSFYYLGFWVPGSAKMDYKANFSPFELAVDALHFKTADVPPHTAEESSQKSWQPFSSKEEALSWLNSAGYLDR